MFTIIGGDGKEYGPATVAQIRSWIAAGRANLDTKAKSSASDEWRPLGDYPEFAPETARADLPPPIPTSGVAAAALEPADRWSRLGAWFVDTVLALLCCLPGVLIVGTSVIASLLEGHVTDLADNLSGRAALGIVFIGLGGLVLFVIQVWMLTTRGQTVGKRLLDVRIVRVLDGSNPGFISAFLLRAAVPALIAMVLNIVPGLGGLFSLVDIFFIFRADRRCIHDFIAGTRVVKA